MPVDRYQGNLELVVQQHLDVVPLGDVDERARKQVHKEIGILLTVRIRDVPPPISGIPLGVDIGVLVFYVQAPLEDGSLST